MTNMRRTDLGISSRSKPVSTAPATSMAPVVDHRHLNDRSFDLFNNAVRQHFEISRLEHGPNLFTTDVNPNELIDAYLDNMPSSERQHHNCDCCKAFLRRYGALVFIDKRGNSVPAIWGDSGALMSVPQSYRSSFSHMQEIVREARITGVFLHNQRKWGTLRAGGWTHLSLEHLNHNNNDFFFRAPRDKTLDEVVADKKQHFETLLRTVNAYNLPVLQQAVTLLEADAFYRSEQVLGPAQFLRDLYRELQGRSTQQQLATIWQKIATIPIGFVNIRSGVLGTLLDDLKAGKSVHAAGNAFGMKMQPDKYMRPEAAPAAGAIVAAEQKVAKMGVERSLARRAARMSDLTLLWNPNSRNPVRRTATAGVFSSVTAKTEKPMVRPSIVAVGEVMTFSRFQRSVLPNVERMEIYLPGGSDSFAGFTAAVHADAPPIIQWDDEVYRNTVAWYMYQSDSTPTKWGLKTGWQKVNGISLLPHMWREEQRSKFNARNGALFIIDGCRDLQNPGACLFPEILKSDMHSMRSVIESYSQANSLIGTAVGDANGILFDDKQELRVNVVLRGSVTALYTLRKWD